MNAPTAHFVTVYDKSGEGHKKSLANARDLVVNAGWSWKPGKQFSPVQSAPYAGITRVDPHAPSKAQQVINKARDAASGQAPVESYEEQPEPEIEVEEVYVAPETADLDADTDLGAAETAPPVTTQQAASKPAATPVPAAPEAPVRRGRPSKKG